nr:MAG TPA: hypothetical protein [Caudoviricetes sp.]
MSRPTAAHTTAIPHDTPRRTDAIHIHSHTVHVHTTNEQS